MSRQGYFITFEGIEGVGKSTQLQHVFTLLTEQQDAAVIMTREPGGTRAGELIRELLLHDRSTAIDPLTELLLVFAARAQHVREVIIPALEENKIVLCDRFTDASYAYQGYGRGVSLATIAALEQIVQEELRPQLTILLDAPVTTGTERVNRRGSNDRFESEQQEFFESTRAGYLALAAAHPDRIHTVDASQAIESVQAEIRSVLVEKGLLA